MSVKPLNCFPKPQQTCGKVIPDACVSVSAWPDCFRTHDPDCCYRQIDFNDEAGYQICLLKGSVTTILDSIDLSTLTGCTAGEGTPGEVVITPVKGTVVEEFQNIYDLICGLQTNLDIPLSGIDFSCLVDKCGTPIGTLGQLLQAMVNQVCQNVGKEYVVTLKQSGTLAPVPTILTDTLDLSSNHLVWSWSGTGIYVLTATGPLAGIFANDKTFIQIGQTGAGTNQITATKASNSTIIINTTAAGTLTNGILNETSFLIKVYP